MAIYIRNKKSSARLFTICEYTEEEGVTKANVYLSDVEPTDFDELIGNLKSFNKTISGTLESIEIGVKVSHENRMYDYGEFFETENTNTTLPETTTFAEGVMNQMTVESLNELRIVREEAGDFENAAILRDEIKKRNESKNDQ